MVQGSRFATDFSYDKGMFYFIACSRDGDFQAVAPMAACLIRDCDGGSEPVAYLDIHGISDYAFPINGAIDLTNTFVTYNRCQQKNQTALPCRFKTEASLQQGHVHR